jgi:hypothetical protein
MSIPLSQNCAVRVFSFLVVRAGPVPVFFVGLNYLVLCGVACPGSLTKLARQTGALVWMAILIILYVALECDPGNVPIFGGYCPEFGQKV